MRAARYDFLCSGFVFDNAFDSVIVLRVRRRISSGSLRVVRLSHVCVSPAALSRLRPLRPCAPLSPPLSSLLTLITKILEFSRLGGVRGSRASVGRAAALKLASGGDSLVESDFISWPSLAGLVLDFIGPFARRNQARGKGAPRANKQGHEAAGKRGSFSSVCAAEHAHPAVRPCIRRSSSSCPWTPRSTLTSPSSATQTGSASASFIYARTA